MSYQSIAFNVMTASPTDVAAERMVIRQVIFDWNAMHSQHRGIVLMPLGWETHASPEIGGHPQKILNKQVLKRSDLLVGVFWTRLGTPTETHESGSVEEVEEHVAAGKPTMLYFSKQPVRLDSVDDEQYKKLLAFKASYMAKGLLSEYEDIGDFREKFFRQLQIKINDDPYFNTGNAPSAPSSPVAVPPTGPALTKDAAALLSSAAKDNGLIMRLAHLSGTNISAGQKEFVETQNPREVARWEATIRDLERMGLIEDKAGKRQLYFLTNKGFEAADRFSS